MSTRSKTMSTMMMVLIVVVAALSIACSGESRESRSMMDEVNGVIAFSSVRGGSRDVYVMDAVMDSDGSNQTRLTRNPQNDGQATWRW